MSFTATIGRIRSTVVGQALNIIVFPVVIITSLILVVKPMATAVLLFGGIVFLVFVSYPTIGICSIFISHPFDTITRPSINSPLTLTKGLIIVLLFVIVLKALLTKDPLTFSKMFDNRLTITAYLFLLISIVSIVNVVEYKLFAFQIIRRISFVLLYLLIITLVTDSRIFKKVLAALLIGYLLAACLGVYEMTTGNSIAAMRWGSEIKNSMFATGTALLKVKASQSSDPTVRDMGFRLFGLEGSSNFQAFAMILPATLSLFFLYLSKSKFIQIAMMASFVLFVINILGTATRGGIVALFIAVFLFLAIIKMRRKFLIASVGLIGFALFMAVLIYVAPPALYERLTFQTESGTVSYRTGLMKMGLAIIKDHPFAGIGVGNFIPVSNRYFVPEVPHASPIIIHNCFLQAWVESGILGFLVYAALYLFTARNIYVVFKESRDPFLKAAASALLATLGSYFFYVNIDPFMENEKYWMFFAFSTAIFNLHQANKRDAVLQEA